MAGTISRCALTVALAIAPAAYACEASLPPDDEVYAAPVRPSSARVDAALVEDGRVAIESDAGIAKDASLPTFDNGGSDREIAVRRYRMLVLQDDVGGMYNLFQYAIPGEPAPADATLEATLYLGARPSATRSLVYRCYAAVPYGLMYWISTSCGAAPAIDAIGYLATTPEPSMALLSSYGRNNLQCCGRYTFPTTTSYACQAGDAGACLIPRGKTTPERIIGFVAPDATYAVEERLGYAFLPQ